MLFRRIVLIKKWYVIVNILDAEYVLYGKLLQGGSVGGSNDVTSCLGFKVDLRI